MRRFLHITTSVLIVWSTALTAQDHLNMRQLSRLAYWTPEGLVGNGGFLYIAAGWDGLRILDITDPERPFEAAWHPTAGFARDVASQGDYVFVADGWAGMTVVDLSDPHHPEEVGYYDGLRGEAGFVELGNGLAYLSYGANGLCILDISDPQQPRDVGLFDPDWDVDKLAWAGEYLCALDTLSGLHVLDVTDPEDVEEVGNFNVGGLSAYDFHISGSTAFQAYYGGGLAAVSLQRPDRPTLLDRIQGEFIAVSVTGAGDYVYFADAYRGNIRIVDAADPRRMSLVGAVGTSSNAALMATREDLLVTCPSDGGVRLYDLTEPDNPGILGLHSIGYDILGVTATERYVCLLGRNLSIVDITEVDKPVVLSSIPVSGAIDPFTVVEHHVFIPCGSGGLQIYNITDPRHPELAGSYTARYFSPRDVKVIGNLAYAITNHELWIFDVSEVADPQPLGRYTFHGYAYPRTLAIWDDQAFIACAYAGLRILDVSNPRRITQVGGLDLEGLTHAIAVNGDLAYVLGWEEGLRVIDVADPFDPIEVGFCQTPEGRAIALNGDVAYLACDWAGVRMIDISDPERPEEVGFWDDGLGSAAGVAVYEDAVLAAGRNYFAVYENTRNIQAIPPQVQTQPAEFLLRTYPNPFNARAMVEYNLTTPGLVSVRVFDPVGREVVRLADGWFDAGTHLAVWDASTTPGGTYFVRLESIMGKATQSVQIVK